MKRYDAGTSGGAAVDGPMADELDLAQDWRTLVEACVGGHGLRPVQVKALVSTKMLDTRRHLVVSAPTNSGKSLIGYLALFEALRAGKRAVLLEPLRSLAQEKADELRGLVQAMGDDSVPRVLLSTGDYRLEHESFADPAPDGGELIVATPERLDAILRNPDNSAWSNTIGCLVVDEAHLIGTSRRGPTLELVIATLLASARPPRVVLLSATAGEPEHLRDWLEPCDLIVEELRTPALSVEVWDLDESDDADECLGADIAEVLSEKQNSVLIFVYRRAATTALASRLEARLGEVVVAYHSGLSPAQRSEARGLFVDGQARVVVATTALALGVNLPATHVYVRDTTFYGHSRVGLDELLQMTGRAGRGTREGHAVVLVGPKDTWSAAELVTALRTRDLPRLDSAFHALTGRGGESDASVEQSAQLVATCLSRAGDDGITIDTLRTVLERTLAGPSLGALVQPSLAWLEDQSRALAFQGNDGHYRLTVLGLHSVRAVLPLPYAAGLGQLLRDLMSLDAEDAMLSQLTPLDHLLMSCLLSGRHQKLRKFGEKLAEQIDNWHESQSLSEKSLLFRRWIAGSAQASKADELCGSLGVSAGKDSPGLLRKRAYVAMLGAIILSERARGVNVADLERRWGLKNLAGVEESWRDVALWLMAGQARVLDLRSFYHHLVEDCETGVDRIQRVKRILRNQRHHCFELIEKLKYCSPLGPLLLGLRKMLKAKGKAVAGVGTIRRLEDAGVTSMAQLAGMTSDEIVKLGVQPRFAQQIYSYLRRRLR